MKNLSLSLRKSGGRNNLGRICSFHIGGGHKQRYRLINFDRTLTTAPIIVRSIEKDPNRTAYIALVSTRNGTLFYILSPETLRVGDVIISGDADAVMVGASMLLRDIPLGYLVHNISMNNKFSLVRAAGCYGQILKKTLTIALIKLPSGQKVRVSLNNTATIGKLSNPQHYYNIYYKAGRIRWLGKTPSVRGVAMNPVDHPMGGKTPGKLHKTPWGKLTKGIKTRKKLKNGL